ncbi:MAG: hypothetical protein IRZ15_11210 [Bryobacteraceae bacterium]|nr:hypothetical protein [Bryobacteraceae bacterium]
MNRREFTKRLGLGSLALSSGIAGAQSNRPNDTPTLYYVDGYHGGVKGHMPAGSWRDILNALREFPQWKLCLDIEPASWDVLKREDPQAYLELKAYLDEQPVDARIEMVNGTFAQPYGWANGGESNIRQVVRGLEIIRAHFPAAVVETYAVQEPCWASCLPQILLSLGFRGAVLKNPSTAWGGYTAGFDAEVVNWVGPDGSSIPAVPRYAVEELLKTWETESVTGSPEFSRKCVAAGILHPAGMCFQDLGWAAKPRVKGDHIRFVTWREYMQQVAGKPVKDWRFTAEDILVTLPWGEMTLQNAAQQVRSAEVRLLAAEKLCAIAWMERGRPWPAADLERAWDDLLWAQHHDSWITVTTRTGRRAWAFQVGAGTMNAEETANRLIAESAQALCAGSASGPQVPLGPQWVRAFNTLGWERTDLAELTLPTDRGTQHIRVKDADGVELPVQVIRTRTYMPREGQQAAGKSINTATVLFRPRVPSLGYATYKVEPVYNRTDSAPAGGARAQTERDGTVTLENDLYRIKIDPARGGVISSLYAKAMNREFCDPSARHSFNEYRGYFIEQKAWRSSSEQPAQVTVVENGPLRARVRIAGTIGGCPWQTTVTLVEGQRRIDFQVRFVYQQDTWIGDPWDIKPEDRRTERRRSHHDGRWKLQALFPTNLKNQAIYKDAAYDVCKSRNRDTFFQRWDEIKHNIIHQWVDVLDEQANVGLALFSDHTTGYTHGPEHPLSLVLGWGWEGGFWWGKRPLRGVQQIEYSLLPHSGRWDQAQLWQESCRRNEPIAVQIMPGQPEKGSEARSLIGVSGSGIEIPTALVKDNNLFVRLFNAEGDETERSVSFHLKPARVELVELDGRVIRELSVTPAGNGRHEVRFALPRFAIRTLRVQLETAKA